MPRNFFTEVTGNRVSDHYTRNIHIKVFLKTAVLWILLTSEVLYENISRFVRKYLQLVQLHIFSLEIISSVVSFSRIFSIHSEHLLQEYLRVFVIQFLFFFNCNVSSNNLLSFFLSFFLY